MISRDDLEKAMKAMYDAPRRRDVCPPHLVHPKEYARGISDKPTDYIMRCANLCGWAAFMNPPR